MTEPSPLTNDKSAGSPAEDARNETTPAQKQGISLSALFAVGGFTFLSRILGYGRDVLFAATLGTSPMAQAFFVAFRLPNMFRRIFAEGAMSTAFIPNYTETLTQQGPAQATLFLRQVLGWLILALLILTAVVVWFMPQVMAIVAPGFKQDAQLFSFAVLYGRVQFPYLVTISLLALGAGVLQAHKRFAAAAAAPMALNVILIVVMLVSARWTLDQGLLLSWVVFFSGFAQLLIVVWALHRAQLLVLRPLLGWSKQLGTTFKMMGPALLSAGVWHVNTLINTMIASQEQQAVAILYYADRLYQLPLGLIGVAFGVVLLPHLSRALQGEHFAQVQHSIDRSLEMALLIALPAMCAMLLLSQEISITLFERGDFVRADSLATALALMAMAIAVPAAVFAKIFLPLYYAHKDTRTPFIQALITVACNVCAALFFFFLFKAEHKGYFGLALATSLAAWIMLVMQVISLARKGYWQPSPALLGQLGRICLAGLVMAGLLWLFHNFGADLFEQLTQALRFAALFAVLLFGSLCYGLCAKALGVESLRSLIARLRRRKS